MKLYQKNITFALILVFIFVAFGVAAEETEAEKQMNESALLNELKALKERIAQLENALAQLTAKLEQMPGPPRKTSDSGVDVDPEKHRLEIEQHLSHYEIDVEAQKRKLELEQDLAHAQAEQQRNIITFSAEQEGETTKFQYEMEQAVQEREYEMKREVEKARVEQEQEIREREIEMALVIETKQIDQHRQVQEAVEKAQIEKYTAVHLAEMDAELERQRKELEITQEMPKVKEEMAAIEAEHRNKMAILTRLVVLPLHVKASEIADLVEPFLSEHATVSVDDEGKVLVIRDVEDCVKDAEMIVEKLDVLREKNGRETK